MVTNDVEIADFLPKKCAISTSYLPLHAIAMER